jgi:acetolactate synthase-1/2/3 large subunit
MNYGGRVVGTTLRHSDYAGLARALGSHGERVERPEELNGALEPEPSPMPLLWSTLSLRKR